MRGNKCSLIFMRKVTNRLNELEERYKELRPKERAHKINEQLLTDFCFGKREAYNWKNIVELANRYSEVNCTETAVQPTHLLEIAKLPEEKQGEIIRQVQEQNMTVQETKALVQQTLAHDKPIVPLPEGLFDVIYADPPWQYDVNFLSASPDSHYFTMKTDDICKKEIPSADDAILFLWATNPLLKDALRVMESWGFNYKTNLVWVKDKIGLGFYFRGQHELLLTGIKGNFKPPLESLRISSVLHASVREHSRKPDAVYETIEKMYPLGKRIELFARHKREGWTSWGNEL